MAHKIDPTRVAKAWLQKQAFNKENPVDLLSQLHKVLERAHESADEYAQEQFENVLKRLKALGRDVQTAWRNR